MGVSGVERGSWGVRVVDRGSLGWGCKSCRQGNLGVGGGKWCRQGILGGRGESCRQGNLGVGVRAVDRGLWVRVIDRGSSGWG